MYAKHSTCTIEANTHCKSNDIIGSPKTEITDSEQTKQPSHFQLKLVAGVVVYLMALTVSAAGTERERETERQREM